MTLKMDETTSLAGFFRQQLLENVVPFWLKHGLDRENGGIFSSLDRDGSVLDRDKAVWPQARFAWLMAKLYNHVEQRSEWLDAARQTCEFLDKFGYDSDDGRMWFHLTETGQPIRKRRYSFSESFAAIAYGELAKATGEEYYRSKAVEAFRKFTSHDPRRTEFGSKFTDQRPTRGLGVPMITIITAQELRDSMEFSEADHWITGAISEIQKFHVKEDLRSVMETVGKDGEILTDFEGRTLNPGHAIEGAWFILAEADRRKDSSLLDLGCKMLDFMWQRGWDQKYGGLYYFVSVDDRPIQEYWHDMKFWWPHNEATIATLYAYLLTGDKKYEDWFRLVFCWSFQCFADREHGEWFGYLNRDGSVNNRLKGNHWKGPFHLPRMLFVCWKLLERFGVDIEVGPLTR